MKIDNVTIVHLRMNLFIIYCDASQGMGSTWHQKVGWKANEYFDDPKVSELYHAIETDDPKKIDRLVAAGANVNVRGKDNI